MDAPKSPGVTAEEADAAIAAAGRRVKTAIVMLERGCGRDEAEQRLREAEGFVRAAIGARPHGGTS